MGKAVHFVSLKKKLPAIQNVANPLFLTGFYAVIDVVGSAARTGSEYGALLVHCCVFFHES